MAQAIAAEDGAAIRELFTTSVASRAITPRRSWEVKDPGGVCHVILGAWFGPGTTGIHISEQDGATSRGGNVWL